MAPLTSSISPSTYHSVSTTLVFSFLLTLLIPSSSASIEDYDTDYQFSFISWGERCKIPGPGELQLTHEGCDGTKGIICQKYSQGTYCGCPIESTFLSYDKRSGECRRKPGEFCHYVNTTSHPNAYKKFPAQVKCHEAAECVKRVITSEEALAKRSTREVDKCICRWGYIPSRDGLQCDSVNRSASLFSSADGKRDALLLNLLGILVLLRFW